MLLAVKIETSYFWSKYGKKFSSDRDFAIIISKIRTRCVLFARLKRKTTSYYGIRTARTINRKYNRPFATDRFFLFNYCMFVTHNMLDLKTNNESFVIWRRCKMSRNNTIYGADARNYCNVYI